MSYTSDLDDSDWEILQPEFAAFGLHDDNRKYPIRTITSAIMYVVNNGTKWRDLPNDFPPWQAVYYNFSSWSKMGVFDLANFNIAKATREAYGRDASPSLVSVDSQSQGGEPGVSERGLDGNKKVNGRKRHILVDVLGLIFLCAVTPANESDVHAGNDLAKTANNTTLFPRLGKILGDSTYGGVGNGLDVSVTVESKEREPGQKGFVPEAFRWVVERTFSWLNRQRRLVRNYEKRIENQESMIFIGNIRLCLKKLKKAPKIVA